MPTLNWIGKDKIITHHNDVPFKLLEKKYSFGPDDNSGNMIVHGDNLFVLKSLLPRYEGQINCIYIDPPYNTGTEGWVYNDNVNDPRIKKWLGEVVGAEGEDLSRHDKWICMMYPRLKLAQKLLDDNGLIFISIDDNELYNLKTICNEIFGESAYVGTLVWLKKRKGSFLSKKIVSLTEYILVYAKSNASDVCLFGGQPDSSESQPIVKRTNALDILSFKGNTVKTKLPDGIYYAGKYGEEINLVTLLNDVIVSNGLITNDFSLEAHFTWKQEFLESELNKGTQVVINTMNFQPRVFRAADENKFKGFASLINGVEIKGTNEDAYEQLEKIFGEKKKFDYSKPSNLIKTLINAATHFNKNALVLDFFAGSGTTGQAVLELNKEDGGKRKYIEIEMMDYAETIAAERIRIINRGFEGLEPIESSFSFFELGESIFDDDGNLNPNIPDTEIKKFIYYTETHKELEEPANDSFMGESNSTAYYIFYDKENATCLNYESLKKVSKKADAYVIYADTCTLPSKFMEREHIIFKKIPRDIQKL